MAENNHDEDPKLDELVALRGRRPMIGSPATSAPPSST